MESIEKIYREHHSKNRKVDFMVLGEERGTFLREHIGEGKKVCDLGCRDGALTSYYTEGNEVLGVDIDTNALNRAKEKHGIDTKYMDLNADWDLPTEYFDVVVACELLEHVFFPDRICSEVSKILKPEGLFMGTIPHAYSLQSKVKFMLGINKGTPLSDPTHINHFSVRMLKEMLSKNFEVQVIETWTPSKYQLFAKIFPSLFADDLMFVARKKTN